MRGPDRVIDSKETSIRVCHLGKFYPPAPGGIESHVQTLAREQTKLGARVQVLCTNHLDRQGKDISWRTFGLSPSVEETDQDVRVRRIGRWASVSRFDICPSLPWILTRMDPRELDVLHVHVPNPTMILALAASPLRIPVIITYHSDIVRQRLLRLALLPFERRVFGRARLILSDSPTYIPGSQFLKSYMDKVDALPLGIDLAPYERPSTRARQHAQELRSEFGTPLWLVVGRLVYYKGIHNAIRALPRVPGTLMVVGSGPLRGELEALATEVGVADRVVWRGYTPPDELVGCYHAATALWMPSNARSEAFGLVQVEAMSSGCPVINSAIPDSGVAWVSLHEQTGLTVPVDDPEALAAAANRMLNEPGLRNRLAEAARKRAATEFSARMMAERSLAFYQRALGRTGLNSAA